MPDIEPPISFARYLDRSIGRVNHWARARWDAPGLVQLDLGVSPVGRAEEEGLRRHGSHFLTPETELTTHYFFANSRNYKLHDAAVDQAIAEWQRIGFGQQDKPMLEAVQSYMGGADLLAEKPVLLLPDAAAMRARRILAQRIQQETARSPQ
jgi:vanillate O-demethylase monooxygenase subunit